MKRRTYNKKGYQTAISDFETLKHKESTRQTLKNILKIGHFVALVSGMSVIERAQVNQG